VWLHAAGPGAGAGYDFASYLQAARVVATGGNPYHRLALEYAAAGSTPIAANGYVYPPLLAALLAIPVRLGLSGAAVWLLWNLLGLAALGWMAVEVARTLWGRAATAWALPLLALALLPAIATYDLSLGQADLLVLGLAAGALARNARGAGLAALPLGLAIAIKPQLGLLLGVWLWRREWRAALAAGLIALGGVVAPFAVAGGMGAVSDYASFFLRWNAIRGSAEPINQSLYGALLRLFTPNAWVRPLVAAPWLVLPLRIIGSVAALGLWLWRAPRHRPADPARALAQEALAFPVILLVSPLSEDIHYCLLIAPLVILGAWAATRGGWRWHPSWPVWALLAAYLIFCIPRAQELLYPGRLLPVPDQASALGALLAQAQADLFFALACLVFAAGLAAPLWGAHDAAPQPTATASASQPDTQPAPYAAS
ncbi:MAG: DUF2029 domain-containing protein, partial [Chloroflexota bacterium]|nr:DUF2029 domain-containing protein [Chloroflexota bacterium]